MSSTRRLRRMIAVGLVALAAAALPSTAGAALGPAGSLAPLTGPGACWNSGGAGGCDVLGAQVNGNDVAVTATHVYSIAGGALIVYRRLADGRLETQDCMRYASLTGCTRVDALLDSARQIVLSPDGDTAYVATGFQASTSRILTFSLGANGGISSRVGCLSEQVTAGCTDVLGLDQPTGLTLGADTLYAAAQGTAGGLTAFDLNASGVPTAQRAACVRPAGGSAACGTTSPLTLAFGVALRGSTLYAAWHGSGGATNGVEWYSVGVDGSIGALQGCVGDNNAATGICTQVGGGLTFPETLAVSPDGAALAVGGGRGLSVFARSPSGAVGARLSCDSTYAEPVGTGCVDRADAFSPTDLDVAADGRTISVSSYDGGYWSFATGANGGRSALLNCLAIAVAGCDPLPVGGMALGVATAPDGLTVYGNGQTNGALVALRRQAAPTCSPATATTTAPAPVTVALTCTDANGDPLTYEVVGTAGGTATVTGSSLTFIPGAPGTATVDFRASDGGATSDPARVTITVSAPPPGPPPGGATVADPDSGIAVIARGLRARALKRLRGTASGATLSRVQISLVRLQGGARAARAKPAAGKRCRRLTAKGTLGRPVKPVRGRCRPGAWLAAKGTTSWTFTLRRGLPPGSYVVYSRAVGRPTERTFSAKDGNRRTFTLR